MSREDWTTMQCSGCRGYGVVGEGCFCPDCGGSGELWVSPSGTRVAEYPGGPFRGSLETVPPTEEAARA